MDTRAKINGGGGGGNVNFTQPWNFIIPSYILLGLEHVTENALFLLQSMSVQGQ